MSNRSYPIPYATMFTSLETTLDLAAAYERMMAQKALRAHERRAASARNMPDFANTASRLGRAL